MYILALAWGCMHSGYETPFCNVACRTACPWLCAIASVSASVSASVIVIGVVIAMTIVLSKGSPIRVATIELPRPVQKPRHERLFSGFILRIESREKVEERSGQWPGAVRCTKLGLDRSADARSRPRPRPSPTPTPAPAPAPSPRKKMQKIRERAGRFFSPVHTLMPSQVALRIHRYNSGEAVILEMSPPRLGLRATAKNLRSPKRPASGLCHSDIVEIFFSLFYKVCASPPPFSRTFSFLPF